MGWYTNYEVELDDYIEWNDEDVKRALEPLDVKHLYLREMNRPRLMFCIYSHHSIQDVLIVLKALYQTKMTYRVYYNNNDWFRFA